MLASLPKPLKKNSKIGLICPASGFVDYKPIQLIVKYLNDKGYRVKLGKSLIKSKNEFDYLSGSDKQRLNDLHSFFKDKSIDAIFCLRGGYGSLRLLQGIDFKLILRNKKILMGYSDITVLLLAIFSKCNFITFHGPLIGTNFLNKEIKSFDSTTEKYIWKLLSDENYLFRYTFRRNTIVINKGKATGTLLGGNLTNLCAMIGSGYLPDFKKSVLFLEDVNEEPYKIDRLMTQLVNAKVFEHLSGVVFGGFENSKFKNVNKIASLIKDRLKKYHYPVICNFPVGHGKKNFVLPIGSKVILDTSKRVLYSF